MGEYFFTRQLGAPRSRTPGCSVGALFSPIVWGPFVSGSDGGPSEPRWMECAQAIGASRP
eukprot:3041450-Alexandrium_andersonii.AAC.1